MKDIINKIRLMENSVNNIKYFISSIENHEERVMHSKCDNIEIIIKDKADEVIQKRFDE